MKNLTKFGTMLLAAALCLGMTSFSEDNNNEGGVGGSGGSANFASNNPLIKEAKMLLTKIKIKATGASDNIKIKYDGLFRPKEFTHNMGSKTFIDYETGTIYEQEKESGKVTFTPQGYIKRYSYSWNWSEDEESLEENTSYTYNSEGHATKVELKDNGKWKNVLSITSITSLRLTSLEWKDENMVKKSYPWKENWNGGKDEEKEFATIEYSSLDNRFRQFPYGFMVCLDLDILGGEYSSVGLWGIGPKKLPKRMVADDGNTYTFEYELSPNGAVKQEIVKKTDDEGKSYTYKYKYYYTPIN